MDLVEDAEIIEICVFEHIVVSISCHGQFPYGDSIGESLSETDRTDCFRSLLLSSLSEQDALLRRPIRMLEDPSSAHSGLKTVNYTQRI